MSPWWDPGAPPSHADDAEAPPPSPPSPPGGLSRAFTALGTVGTSLSSLFSKAPPPLLSGAPHQRAAVLSRSAPPAQPYQTLLPGVTAAAAAQSTAAAAAAAVDAAQATALAAAGTTRGRRRSTLSGQRERQRQQVESAALAASQHAQLHLAPEEALGPYRAYGERLWGSRRPARSACPLRGFSPPGYAACRSAQGHRRRRRRWIWRGKKRRRRPCRESRSSRTRSIWRARAGSCRAYTSIISGKRCDLKARRWVFTSPRTAPKLSIHNSRTTSTAPERRRR